MLFLWQDLRPLYAGRCQYYSKSTTPPEVRAGSAVSCSGTSFLVQVEEPAARWLLQCPGGLQSEEGVGGWAWGGSRVLGALGRWIPPCTASIVKEQVERRGCRTGKFTSFSRSSAVDSLQELGGGVRFQAAVISVYMSNKYQPLHLSFVFSKEKPVGDR